MPDGGSGQHRAPARPPVLPNAGQMFTAAFISSRSKMIFPVKILPFRSKKAVFYFRLQPRVTILSIMCYLRFNPLFSLTGSKKKTVVKYLKYRNIIDTGLLCEHLDMNS
jgi:hypothetical protein